MLMEEVTVDNIKTSERTKIFLAGSSNTWIGRYEVIAKLFTEVFEREAMAGENSVSAGGKSRIVNSAAIFKGDQKKTAKRSHE